jgi:hypothetical protein
MAASMRMTSDMKPLFEGIRFVGTPVPVKTLASDFAAALSRAAQTLCDKGAYVKGHHNLLVV